MEHIYVSETDNDGDISAVIGPCEEIIRCRDCKKINEIQLETNQPCSTEPDGFCAWAERREQCDI